MSRKQGNTVMPIGAVRHTDRRKNIHTEGTARLCAEDGAGSKTLLYLCDPSLDPQRFCKGKGGT